MEKEPHYGSDEQEYSLAQFQEEMAGVVAKEVSGERESAHFLVPGTETKEPNPDFDPSKLTGEGMNIWKAICEGTITPEHFHRYAGGVATLDKTDPARASRRAFSDFAGNETMRIMFEREMKEEKERGKKE